MELRRYIDMLLRWWWLLALGALLMSAVVLVANKRAVPIYRAQATLLVDQAQQGAADYSSVLLNESLAATYSEWLATRPVLEAAVARLQLPKTADEIAGAITVIPVRDTQLILLSVEDASPEQAAAIANTIPEIFREQNQALQSERFAAARSSIETQLTQVQNQRAQLQEASERADVAGDTADYLRLQSSLREVETFELSLTNSLAEVRLEEARSAKGLFSIEPAQIPTNPVRPQTMRNTLMAALIGLLAALGIVLALEYLNDVVRSPEEVSTDLGLATVGVVPEIPTNSGELTVITHSGSGAAEAYRVLRTNLQFSSVDRPLHTLLVTSPSAGEGKTRTAANLAAALAQAGKEVILVDADLRRPRIHRVFGLPNNVGLTTTMLDGGAAWQEVLSETTQPGLRVLTSGPVPPNPAELVGSARMASLLAELSATANYVVLDSSPILAASDTATLATQTDGVLLVLQLGVSRRGVAVHALEALDRVNARMVGAILNRVPARGHGYYYGYYGRYYGYSDSDDANSNTPASNGRFKKRGRSPGVLVTAEPLPGDPQPDL